MRHWAYLVDRLVFSKDHIEAASEGRHQGVDAYVQSWLEGHGRAGWELIEIQGAYQGGLIGVFKREILH